VVDLDSNQLAKVVVRVKAEAKVVVAKVEVKAVAKAVEAEIKVAQSETGVVGAVALLTRIFLMIQVEIPVEIQQIPVEKVDKLVLGETMDGELKKLRVLDLDQTGHQLVAHG
jgi:hypothetical protein